MYQIVDIEQWNRKGLYSYYRQFEDPFFSICTQVDVKRLVEYCKAHRLSFQMVMLFYVCQVANEIEAFRLRIDGDKVLIFEEVNISAPVLNEEDLLSFCVLNRKTTLNVFLEEEKEKMMQLKQQPLLNTNEERLDLLHTTTLPWHSFTAFKHPKRLDKNDSIPKIAWGKYMRHASKIKMPLAVEVNHALMDGIHVAQFITTLQQKLLQIEES